MPLVCPAQRGQTTQTGPRQKLFADRTDGVTFTYPAAWLLNADDDAATAKLRLADYAPPRAVVQLEGNFTGQGPYKNTDFDAGAFAYTAVPAETEAACFLLLNRLAGRESASTPLGQRQASEVRFTASVAGTEDIHHALAIFRRNRCLLFEAVLIRRSADTVPRPLDPSRWGQIMNAFDAVLRSVRLPQHGGT